VLVDLQTPGEPSQVGFGRTHVEEEQHDVDAVLKQVGGGVEDGLEAAAAGGRLRHKDGDGGARFEGRLLAVPDVDARADQMNEVGGTGRRIAARQQAVMDPFGHRHGDATLAEHVRHELQPVVLRRIHGDQQGDVQDALDSQGGLQAADRSGVDAGRVRPLRVFRQSLEPPGGVEHVEAPARPQTVGRLQARQVDARRAVPVVDQRHADGLVDQPHRQPAGKRPDTFPAGRVADQQHLKRGRGGRGRLLRPRNL